MADIYDVPQKLHPTKFSPLNVHYAILEPLKYLFSFVPPEELRYHEDPKETKIIIDSVNNKHQDEEVQKKPRILLHRGSISVEKFSLTDNLVEGQPASETKGLQQSKHTTFIRGRASIMVEASTEGVCEVLADLAMHFIVWSRPHICSEFRFKEFGLPLQIGEAQMDTEDQEKFNIRINIPYMLEDSWQVNEDAIKLKDYVQTLVKR